MLILNWHYNIESQENSQKFQVMLNSEGSEIYTHSFIELVWLPVLPKISHSLASQTPYFSEEKERGSATPNIRTGTSTKQKNVARPIISFFFWN